MTNWKYKESLDVKMPYVEVTEHQGQWQGDFYNRAGKWIGRKWPLPDFDGDRPPQHLALDKVIFRVLVLTSNRAA